MNMMTLEPYEFDQTRMGWRSIDDLNEKIKIMKDYLEDKDPDQDVMIQSIHFHLGQALAMRNLDENDIIYAVHHMKLSLSETDKEWNDYVNATIAFLEKDREAMDKYVGKQNYNDSVIHRLHINFDKDYKDAY